MLIALAVAIAQVALGGVVRVTGSGDACPDWPLCHGQVIPPLDLNIWLEFSHRLSASALGVFVLAASFMAWRQAPVVPVSAFAASSALVLVLVAALLGGLTVLTELAWWARLIHLVLAELVVACIAVAWLAGPGVGRPSGQSAPPGSGIGRVRTVGWVSLAGLLGAIVFGSYMVGFNYGAACTSWPMCQGMRIPDGLAFVANMGHRVSALAVALPIAWLCAKAWRPGSRVRPGPLVCARHGRLPGRGDPARGPDGLAEFLGADAFAASCDRNPGLGLDRGVGPGAGRPDPVWSALLVRMRKGR